MTYEQKKAIFDEYEYWTEARRKAADCGLEDIAIKYSTVATTLICLMDKLGIMEDYYKY